MTDRSDGAAAAGAPAADDRTDDAASAGAPAAEDRSDGAAAAGAPAAGDRTNPASDGLRAAPDAADRRPTPAARDARIEVTGLSAAYAAGPPALRDVTFAAPAGQAVAVLGPNGGGKTTLFRALLGELNAVSGSIAITGATAYVPQTERSRLDFPVSALDVALMGAYARTPWFRRVTATDRSRARAALERVGLQEHARKRFGTLSGGQRQRVLIARALVQDAGVLLLDEPFAGVDHTSEEAIMGILDDLRAEGRVLLIATHDVEQARHWDRVLCLRGEQIAYGPPAETLSNDVLEATYGAEIVLLDCGHRAVAIQHHDHAH